MLRVLEWAIHAVGCLSDREKVKKVDKGARAGKRHKGYSRKLPRSLKGDLPPRVALTVTESQPVTCSARLAR